jgi:hypothetical protein
MKSAHSSSHMMNKFLALYLLLLIREERTDRELTVFRKCRWSIIQVDQGVDLERVEHRGKHGGGRGDESCIVLAIGGPVPFGAVRTGTMKILWPIRRLQQFVVSNSRSWVF